MSQQSSVGRTAQDKLGIHALCRLGNREENLVLLIGGKFIIKTVSDLEEYF